MTRPDDAASVRMLREALTAGLRTEPGWRADAERALAATAPPKPYREVEGYTGKTILVREGRLAAVDYDDLSQTERSAVLDALNALAEKEATNG